MSPQFFGFLLGTAAASLALAYVFSRVLLHWLLAWVSLPTLRILLADGFCGALFLLAAVGNALRGADGVLGLIAAAGWALLLIVYDLVRNRPLFLADNAHRLHAARVMSSPSPGPLVV